MTKVECRYLAKLDMLNSILSYLENDNNLTIDDVIVRLRRSEMFYRNSLAQLED